MSASGSGLPVRGMRGCFSPLRYWMRGLAPLCPASTAGPDRAPPSRISATLSSASPLWRVSPSWQARQLRFRMGRISRSNRSCDSCGTAASSPAAASARTGRRQEASRGRNEGRSCGDKNPGEDVSLSEGSRYLQGLEKSTSTPCTVDVFAAPGRRPGPPQSRPVRPLQIVSPARFPCLRPPISRLAK